jgi:hypothetical protein
VARTLTLSSSNRTLSHEDSEEIGKGIKAISNERLNGFGSGQSPIGSDSALSGRIWIRYAVRARKFVGPRRG